MGREDQLIGRELELAMLAELVEDLAAGRGRVVLLTLSGDLKPSASSAN